MVEISHSFRRNFLFRSAFKCVGTSEKEKAGVPDAQTIRNALELQTASGRKGDPI